MGLHSTEVVEDWTSVFWNTMVWPGGEMELCHLQWIPSNLVTLQEDDCMAETRMKCLSSKCELQCLCKISKHQIWSNFQAVQREVASHFKNLEGA